MKSKRGFLGIIGLSALFSIASIGVSIELFNNSDKPFQANASASSYWDSWATTNASTISSGGIDFLDILQTKINSNTTHLSYAQLWTAYRDSDVVPGTTNKIWDMYGGCDFTYSTDQCGNYSKAGDCYNREHSVPKSWFNGSESDNGYTDLVHLVPTDGYINNIRTNNAFGEVDTSKSYDKWTIASKTSGGVNYQVAGESRSGSPKSINGKSISATTVFEPDDQYKGDFARIYMYFATRYGGTSKHATSDDGGKIFSNTHSDAKVYMTDYGLELVRKWHVLDPVSDKETDRNDVIQSKQGNRNPFVDHPEWADKIFGSNYAETHGGDTPTPVTHTVTITGDSTVEVGDTLTLSASCTQSDSITWSSSNEDLATVSSTGVVTGIAAGEVTITATCVGEGSASKVITVTSSGGGGQEEVSTETIVFSELGYSNGAEVSEVECQASTINFDKGTNKNAPKYYTTGSAVRCYGGNYFTISSTSQNITKIELIFGSDDGNNEITTNVGTYSSGTWTGSTSSVKFTIGGSAGHRRIASIKITYETSQPVVVTLNSISLDTSNVTKSFTVGDTFNYTGLVVTAHYSDSSSKTVNPSSVSSPDMSTVGIKTITVTYTEGTIEKSETYNISVNAAKTLTSIGISVSPTKLTYTAKECFDPTGLVITRIYSDSSSDTYSYANHTSEFLFNPGINTPLKVSNTRVSISYGGKSTSIDITVSNWRVVTETDQTSSLQGSVTYVNSDTNNCTTGVTATPSGSTTYENAPTSSAKALRLGSGKSLGTLTVSYTGHFNKVVVNMRTYNNGSKDDTDVAISIGGTQYAITSTYSDYVKTFDNNQTSIVISSVANSKRAWIATVQLYMDEEIVSDISNTEDCLGLETFIDDYMHMDYVQNLGYCADEEHHYYTSAKAAFNLLNEHQRSLFTTNSAYENEWDRLSNWAEINKDTLDEDFYLTNSKIYSVGDVIGKDNKPMLLIIVAVAAVSLIGVFTLRRKES